MQNGAMKAWLDSSFLSGANQSWIEQLYEDFLTDPDSVDANWRSMFQQLPGTGVKPDQFHSKTRDYFRRLAKDASRYSSAISDPDTNAKQVWQLKSDEKGVSRHPGAKNPCHNGIASKAKHAGKHGHRADGRQRF